PPTSTLFPYTTLFRSHMQDPQVFYNKEDLWTIPRLPQEGRDREMEPYFTIMRLPGEPKEEFVLLEAFNPSGRDNMIGLMAARAEDRKSTRLNSSHQII